MKNKDLVYAVEIYILVLGGDTSATIDTLYFKNKKDAEKVTNYRKEMDIPHTYGIKEVEYGDIPRKYNIIESVSGKNKSEILYNLSPEFKEIVDDYYERHPEEVWLFINEYK